MLSRAEARGFWFGEYGYGLLLSGALGGVVICCVETDQLFCAPFSAKQKEYATYDTPRCSVGTDKGPVAG